MMEGFRYIHYTALLVYTASHEVVAQAGHLEFVHALIYSP